MIHYHIVAALAAERRDALLAEATAYRLARQARGTSWWRRRSEARASRGHISEVPRRRTQALGIKLCAASSRSSETSVTASATPANASKTQQFASVRFSPTAPPAASSTAS